MLLRMLVLQLVELLLGRDLLPVLCGQDLTLLRRHLLALLLHQQRAQQLLLLCIEGRKKLGRGSVGGARQRRA